MINKKDLRIGNLVYPNGENATPYEVSELGKHEANFVVKPPSKGDCLIPYDLLQPIPLSPEWLEMAGFISINDGSFFVESVSRDLYPLLKRETEYNFEEPEGGLLLKNDIRFVHELQNAVFVLAGKELTFKPAPAGSGDDGK